MKTNMDLSMDIKKMSYITESVDWSGQRKKDIAISNKYFYQTEDGKLPLAEAQLQARKFRSNNKVQTIELEQMTRPQRKMINELRKRIVPVEDAVLIGAKKETLIDLYEEISRNW